MGTLSTHLIAFDRQVKESLNILEETQKEGRCLNQKIEWAGARIPDLEVRIPKVIAKERVQDTNRTEERKAGRQESKEEENKLLSQPNLEGLGGGDKRTRL